MKKVTGVMPRQKPGPSRTKLTEDKANAIASEIIARLMQVTQRAGHLTPHHLYAGLYQNQDWVRKEIALVLLGRNEL
jgi:hypothetical protein